VHNETQRNEKQGKTIILIGHKGHPEVEGTSGRVKQDVILVQAIEDVDNITVQDENNLSYVTQTTLSVDDTRSIINALKMRFPNITGPDLSDICYATQNRQDAVKKLAKEVDLVLVIGSKNSSNSNRLRDLSEEIGTKAYLIDGEDSLERNWFENVASIGITAGASAPEILLEKLLDKLSEIFTLSISTLEGVNENVKFKIPPELQ
jgi:4-hydroxy-3-methylbut-2-en-1-yl diphosphate reductase